MIGSALRVVSSMSFMEEKWMFPLVLSGQSISAVAQPFLLFVPTKLAATWFGQNQRATANMMSSMGKTLI